MEAAIIELVIAGRVPGTQTDVNFEAFMQGVVFGLIVLVVLKTAVSVRKAAKESVLTSTMSYKTMDFSPRVYRPRGQMLES